MHPPYTLYPPTPTQCTPPPTLYPPHTHTPSTTHRASEILENVVRYHITACFGALEERVVASISTTLEQAQHIGNRRACAAQLLQLLVDSRSATQTTLKVGVDALLGEMKVCGVGFLLGGGEGGLRLWGAGVEGTVWRRDKGGGG